MHDESKCLEVRMKEGHESEKLEPCSEDRKKRREGRKKERKVKCHLRPKERTEDWAFPERERERERRRKEENASLLSFPLSGRP